MNVVLDLVIDIITREMLKQLCWQNVWRAFQIDGSAVEIFEFPRQNLNIFILCQVIETKVSILFIRCVYYSVFAATLGGTSRIVIVAFSDRHDIVINSIYWTGFKKV